MIRFLALGLAAAMITAPDLASARGWTVLTLGSAATIDECQAKAEAMFTKQGSSLQMGRTGHHVVAYALRGLDIDAAVACADAGNGNVTGTLSVHTWTTDDALDEKRFDLGKELRTLW